jgi:hypothetical protein
MRAALVLLCALAAAAVPAAFASERVAGTLSIESGVGVVTVRGQGTLVGRMERGEVIVNDLTPGDQWSPRINGVPRGRLAVLRGRDVTFYVPGGRYRIALRGETISLSARGIGVALLRARENARFDTGTYATGDDAPSPFPTELTRVAFGKPAEG